ncbi:DUF6152 family protein [Pelagibacterium sp. H642]|uniref:DUF6152 family protein n=1 Tax=Pelagibacterium sp. H642 TaxID=1881069 RepID=UPI002815695D|nr:DUF6152 family protein [Pelagibacterium sp. H642]WMT91928.1 DUF6152 family protein [Pelagibacterium sp. H642]
MARLVGPRVFWAISAISLLSIMGSASAHHGLTGRYDASQPLGLSGVVVQTVFAPPHPVLTIRVDTDELGDFEVGRPEEYFGPVITRSVDLGDEHAIELPPVGMFYALNARLQVGDRITVVALRNCLAPHQLRSTWLRLADGEIISYTGDWAPSVDGCS